MDPKLRKVPVYEIKLVQSRRPLLIAEDTISDAERARNVLHAMIGCADRESFVALFVNAAHEITGAHVVAIGGQSRIMGVEARTVFRAALAACAAAIIIGHNHPSGHATPSSEDIAITRALVNAGDLLGIPVLDHVIVTRHLDRYYSMLDRGTLPQRETP